MFPKQGQAQAADPACAAHRQAAPPVQRLRASHGSAQGDIDVPLLVSRVVPGLGMAGDVHQMQKQAARLF